MKAKKKSRAAFNRAGKFCDPVNKMMSLPPPLRSLLYTPLTSRKKIVRACTPCAGECVRSVWHCASARSVAVAGWQCAPTSGQSNLGSVTAFSSQALDPPACRPGRRAIPLSQRDLKKRLEYSPPPASRHLTHSHHFNREREIYF